MVIDLLILTVIGFALEAFVTKMAGMVFSAAPTFTFSFLIIFIAVTRWNLWGLILVPILPLATLLGGHFNDLPYLAAVYDWRIYLSCVIAFLFLGLNVILFKKNGTKKTINNTFLLILMVLIDFLLFTGLQIYLYRWMTSGNPFSVGNIPFEAKMHIDGSDEASDVIVNLCSYVEHEFVYNLFGLAITFVGLFVLRSQGVVNNVVDKFIDDKKQAELEKASYEKLNIHDELDSSEEAKEDTSDSDSTN